MALLVLSYIFSKDLETPVLLIVFNRPDTTEKVFGAIRDAKPKYLYIAADSPRSGNPDDVEKCRRTLDIVENIDWDCEIQRLYSKSNLGCGKGPWHAITWFFSQVEEGIILEDDCLPHPDFFKFCSELLLRYRHNESVLSITGSNFQDGKKRGDASYYFSIHNRIWGWASWRRTWENYDYFLNNISYRESNQILHNLFKNKDERMYWGSVFLNSKSNQTNNSAWDFQFMFLQWKLGGLTLTPNTNLITNIGFGADATHTAWGEKNKNLNRKSGPVYPLTHPSLIKRNIEADRYYFRKYIKPERGFIFRSKRKLKKIFNKGEHTS